MKVNPEKKLQFPDVVQSNLRPDMEVSSTQVKKLIAIELAVPLGGEMKLSPSKEN